MAVNNDLWDWPFTKESPFEGSVSSVAVPSWVRPCFAIALVDWPTSNSLFVQEVDNQDRVTALSRFYVPEDAILPLAGAIRGVVHGSPAVHVVIGPDGELLAGNREELALVVAPWLPKIEWPVTRLAFADFVGDEQEILAAADAALQDKTARYGRHEASVWFATSVVFRRLQRGVLDSACSEEHLLELELALDDTVLDANTTDIVVRSPQVILDLFEGANIRAQPGLSMAHKLALLISPRGLSVAPVGEKSTTAGASEVRERDPSPALRRVSPTVSQRRATASEAKAPFVVTFIGRVMEDAADDLLSQLGHKYRTAPSIGRFIRSEREARDRMLHSRAVRKRGQQRPLEMAVPAPVIEHDLKGAAAAVIFCDVRNTFDATALKALLDGLAASEIGYFAFVTTEPVGRLSRSVRLVLEAALEAHARDMMVSVGGTPLHSNIGLLTATPPAVVDSVDMREFIGLLLAANSAVPTSEAFASEGDTNFSEVENLPAFLLTLDEPIDKPIINVLEDRWLPDFSGYGREGRAIVLVSKQDKSDIAEVTTRIRLKTSASVFDPDTSLDSLYLAAANEQSTLWRLLFA